MTAACLENCRDVQNRYFNVGSVSVEFLKNSVSVWSFYSVFEFGLSFVRFEKMRFSLDIIQV